MAIIDSESRPKSKSGEIRSDPNRSVDGTSASLIDGVKQNNPASWERLVRLYSPLVYFWCRETGLPSADLNDVFQEVFYRLARNISKFRPTANGTFRGWLRTLTRNQAMDHFRLMHREPEAVGGTAAQHFLEQIASSSQEHCGDQTTGETNVESHLQHSLLHHALENIRPNFSETSWQAFWLVAIEGRETAEVARQLGMRTGAIRVAKSRVLKRLRLELGDSVELT